MKSLCNQLWQQIPEWLYANVNPYADVEPLAMPEKCSTELRASAVQSLTLVTTTCKHTASALIECERFSTLPRPPPPPPLPKFQLAEDPAFTYTGVDFAGPLYV